MTMMRRQKSGTWCNTNSPETRRLGGGLVSPFVCSNEWLREPSIISSLHRSKILMDSFLGNPIDAPVNSFSASLPRNTAAMLHQRSLHVQLHFESSCETRNPHQKRKMSNSPRYVGKHGHGRQVGGSDDWTFFKCSENRCARNQHNRWSWQVPPTNFCFSTTTRDSHNHGGKFQRQQAQ